MGLWRKAEGRCGVGVLTEDGCAMGRGRAGCGLKVQRGGDGAREEAGSADEEGEEEVGG